MPLNALLPRISVLSFRPACCLALALFFSPLINAQNFNDPGFVDELVTTLVPYKPVGLAFAPDGRLFIWQDDGIVRIFKNGELLPTPFLDISDKVNDIGDRGLLGLAFDPNFASNGYVYLYYTLENPNDPNEHNPRTSRVTRVQRDPAKPDQALPNSEVVILGKVGSHPCATGADCISSDSDSHNGGTLVFAPDGKLFVSLGDGAQYNYADEDALRAQNLNRLEGKMLRINPDGTAPADNPFFDGNPNSNRSKVYSYGLRNPFRVALQPMTGEPLIADVGWNSYEEINRGRGANFGWPCFEGPERQNDYSSSFPACQALSPAAVTQPLYYYGHDDGKSVIGGFVYRGAQFPDKFRDSYFFADYVAGWIRRMIFDDAGSIASVVPFAERVSEVVSMEAGPDGALYYLSIVEGTVRRIRFTNGPLARASANKTVGPSPLTVTFSSAGSFDPKGSAISFLWDFDDGETSTQPNPVHTFVVPRPTTFRVRLTVTNAGELNSTSTIDITAGNNPPVAIINSPAEGAVFNFGETVNFGGSATDADEELRENTFIWQILLHHDQHVHPLLSTSGSGGSFTMEDHGTGVFFYEIILSVTDSVGTTTRQKVSVYPPNKLPAVEITSPGNNLTFNAPVSISFTVKATDADGSIMQVEYFNGATLIGASTAAPFTFVWANAPTGTHQITARATDNRGAVTVSNALTITVSNNAVAPRARQTPAPPSRRTPRRITVPDEF